MTETLIAIALASAVLVGVAQLLAISARHTRLSQQRRVATWEAANVMEEMMARPWDQLLSERRSSSELSNELRSRLPYANLEVAVAEVAAKCKRIHVAIEMDVENPAFRDPVSLVAWRYNRGGAR